MLSNAPFERLEAEVAPHSDWAVYLALVSPRLAVRSFTAEPVAGGAHRLRLVVQNTGWLPTNVSQKAIEQKAVRPVEVDLELGDGAQLVSGLAHTELDQLTGRGARHQHAGLGRGPRADQRAGACRVGGRGARRHGAACRRRGIRAPASAAPS